MIIRKRFHYLLRPQFFALVTFAKFASVIDFHISLIASGGGGEGRLLRERLRHFKRTGFHTQPTLQSAFPMKNSRESANCFSSETLNFVRLFSPTPP